MILSLEQIDILILASAIDSQRMCVARMRRREAEAKMERKKSEDDLHNMQAKLQYLREATLRRNCV